MKCTKLKCEYFNSEMEMNCCYSDDPDKTVLCINSLNTAFYKEGNTERNPNANEVEPEQVKSLLGDSFANWKEFIDSAPKFRQRQDAMNNQLKDLYYVANKLGFYDAADYLRNFA